MNKFDPSMGYLNFSMYVPMKGGHNVDFIKSALSFPTFNAWEITGDKDNKWLRIPKYFFHSRGMAEEDLPFLVYDITSADPHINENVTINTTFDLYDAQQRAYCNMFHEGIPQSGVVSMPCGTGKTVVAIHAMCAVPSPIRAVVVPTIDLAHQWKERFLEHTDLEPDEISILQGGAQKWYWNSPIIIFTIHAAAAAVKARERNPSAFPSELLDKCRVWVYDECHRLGASQFSYAGSAGFGVRWGLSATPYRADGMELLFHSHLGPTLFQAGDERKAKIIFVQTGTAIDMEERKGVTIDGQVSWPLMTTWLTQNSSRQKWLIEHIRYLMDEGREKILVLSPRVVEIRDLQSEFQGCGVLVGGMMAHKRREALTKRLIFASLQLAKEGLDIPKLNTVVITTTFTHPGMFDQVVGRAFRGDNPYVFIPSDNIPEVRRMIKAMKQLSRRRGHNVEDWSA